MMTSCSGSATEYLVASLIERLEETLCEVRVADDDAYSQLEITRSHYDPEKYDDVAPGLFVRPTSGSQEEVDGEEQRVVTVEISLVVNVRVYGDDEFSTSLMDRIMIDLLANRIVDNKYRLLLPLGWVSPGLSEQPYPHWWSVMTARFAIPAISDVSRSFEL